MHHCGLQGLTFSPSALVTSNTAQDETLQMDSWTHCSRENTSIIRVTFMVTLQSQFFSGDSPFSSLSVFPAFLLTTHFCKPATFTLLQAGRWGEMERERHTRAVMVTHPQVQGLCNFLFVHNEIYTTTTTHHPPPFSCVQINSPKRALWWGD